MAHHPSMSSWEHSGNNEQENTEHENNGYKGNGTGNTSTDHTAGNYTPHTSLVLLTGADRLTIDAVTFSLMDSLPSATSITYDVAPDLDPASVSGLSIIRTIQDPGYINPDDCAGLQDGRSTTSSLEDCCLTCACKHDIARTLRSIPGRSGTILVTLPVGVEGTAVAQHLADCSMLGDLTCIIDDIHVATAVGLDSFESLLFDDDRLVIAGLSKDDAVLDSRSTGVVQSRLIREAGHVLVLPLVASNGRAISSRKEAEEARRLLTIVSALADPTAIIHTDAHRTDLSTLINDTCASSGVHV